MTKVRNALIAGTVMASALITPMMTPASFAVADTSNITASAASATLGSVQKPCSEHKHPERCRARRGHGHGGGSGPGVEELAGRSGVGISGNRTRVGIGRTGSVEDLSGGTTILDNTDIGVGGIGR